MHTAVLILAAGSSSRMGTAKQLLAFGETTLLGKAIQNAMLSNAHATYVVLGADAELLKAEVSRHGPVNIIMNPDYNSGLSSSIVKGIEQLSAFDAVLITLADQPKVDHIYLNQMILACKKDPKHIVASAYNNGHGVPAIFPKQRYSDLLKLKGDTGAKSLLNSNAILVKAINSFVNLIDIDTKEDYQNLTKT